MPLVAGSIPGLGTQHAIRCKHLALNIRDCESLCLSEETLKAVGPFYVVSMPGEVKDPTWGKCVNCGGLHILTWRRTTLSTTPVSAQRWAVWSIHLLTKIYMNLSVSGSRCVQGQHVVCSDFNAHQ